MPVFPVYLFTAFQFLFMATLYSAYAQQSDFYIRFLQHISFSSWITGKLKKAVCQKKIGSDQLELCGKTVKKKKTLKKKPL